MRSAMKAIWLAWFVLVGGIAGCGQPRALSPGNSDRAIQVVCVGNTATGEGTSDPALQQTAKATLAVCDGLRPMADVRTVPSTEPTYSEVVQTLRALDSSRPRVLIYAGHGYVDTSSKLRFAFRGSPPDGFSFRDVALALAQADASSAARAGAWAVVVLDACDSAYADVRGIPVPLSVLAAGYGRVTAELPRVESSSALNGIFTRALDAALHGEADKPPIGNGDDVVTDHEAADYINERISGERAKWLRGHDRSFLRNTACARTRPGIEHAADPTCDEAEAWWRAPVAVVRSDTQAELPISATVRSAAARLELTDQTNTLRVTDATDYARLEATRPPSADRPWTPSRIPNRRSYELKAGPSAIRGTYIELRRASDGAVLWAETFPPGVDGPSLWDAALPHLPRAISPLVWGTHPEAQESLWLLVDGRFPTRTVRARRAGARAPIEGIGLEINFSESSPAPCPGTSGQCVFVKRPRALEGSPADWIFEEDP